MDNIQASTVELTNDDLDALEAKFQVLEARALELWKRDQDSALELGRALIAVRDALKDNHGAFTMWYRQHDLDENRVHYCIRKVEGKIKPAAPRPTKQDGVVVPDPDFFLNEHNLAVARFAPLRDGHFTAGCVHVDSEGTTATDGFCLVQVSLPRVQPENRARGEGNIPRDLLMRAARHVESAKKEAPNQIKGMCDVSLGEELTVIASFDTSIQGASVPSSFPNYKKAIPTSEATTEIFFSPSSPPPDRNKGSLEMLIELLTFAKEFEPQGPVRISVHEKCVCIQSENAQGQHLFAMLMQSKRPDAAANSNVLVAEQKALPPAPETEKDNA